MVLAHPAWQEMYRRLDQLALVHASGVLHGPHGVGKSTLLHRWSERLSPKQYRCLRLAHSSLMGSDLLRQLVRLGGKIPSTAAATTCGCSPSSGRNGPRPGPCSFLRKPRT